MVISSLFRVVTTIVLLTSISQASFAVVREPSKNPQDNLSEDLALVAAIEQAEADISLRGLKALDLSEQSGESFLERVMEIKRRLKNE